MPSKLVTTLEAGDRLIVRTAGGGGVGAPQGRSLAGIKDDLANGKISADVARDIYGFNVPT
ncbi:hypothetical protein C7S13_4767 [Burkholderia cepacia]|nr:hypothetical protein [Burkholderia cepacia]